MSIKTVKILDNVLIGLREILEKRIMKKYSGQANSSLMKALDKTIEEVFYLSSPVFQFSIYNAAHITQDSLQLENSVAFTGKNLGFALNGAEYTGVFLVTLGSPVSDRITKYGEESIVHGYLLDEVASELIELCADYVHIYLYLTSVQNKKTVSQRYSPGYCGWDISQQKEIFSVLKSSEINVELTPRFLMIPQKSISAILGIGDKEKLGNPNICIICEDKKDCMIKHPRFTPD